MSRLLAIVAGLSGLFIAAPLAAQEAQPAPAEQTQTEAPPAEQPAPAAAPPAAAPAPAAAPTPAAAAPSGPRVAPPPPPLEADNTWNLDLSTGGRVVIQLRPDVAPQHVERIKALTRQGFYNGLAFFRVIDGFMAQGGDPQNNGTGGSQLADVPAEINGMLHVRGAVGMARAQDLNSANSQFYIMFVPRLQMDRNYTVFGRVVSGMSFIDGIERGEPPSQPSRILRASLGSENVPPMTAEQIQAETTRLASAAPAALAAPRGAAGPAVPAPPSYRPLEPVRGEGAPPRRSQ
ncbi:MAG TPA: peptidylprolyl isomerase [Allosphingosinicella sp.]|nr:peptidylprolyl isomerase [Allosphingosinicella sp.]